MKPSDAEFIRGFVHAAEGGEYLLSESDEWLAGCLAGGSPPLSIQKRLASHIAQQAERIAELEVKNRKLSSDLVLSKGRDARGRTGWKLANESVQSHLRLVEILEHELAESQAACVLLRAAIRTMEDGLHSALACCAQSPEELREAYLALGAARSALDALPAAAREYAERVERVKRASKAVRESDISSAATVEAVQELLDAAAALGGE